MILGNDFICFIKWEIITLILSLLFLPLISCIFHGFKDRGFAFARSVSILICGYFTWLLASGLFKFSTTLVIIVTLSLSLIAFWGGLFLSLRSSGKNFTGIKDLPSQITNVYFYHDSRLIITEEFIFFLLFLFWTYIMGFNPDAYGTEKFMDFGFMANMMRTSSFPSTDLWYSDATLNYYYLGQYYAVYLTKLTFTDVRQTYNIMRAFVAALSFVMPFSISCQFLYDTNKIKASYCRLGGLISGIAVSFCGNMHYVIYGIIGKNIFDVDYWFPDSTRYIGYNPETTDKTIHEFPSYSFILGDLHAHVINIMFVIPLIALLYSFMKLQKSNSKKSSSLSLIDCLKSSQLLLCALFLGVFQGSNFWDYAIYFTVAIIVIFFTNLTTISIKNTIIFSLVQTAALFIISKIIILPFTLNFEAMFQGIGFCQNHTPFYQLMILWGLPITIVLIMAIRAIKDTLYTVNQIKESKSLVSFLKTVSENDYMAVMLGACAIGLILVPEIVYVKDIYTGDYLRSNTMFKFTYQAFIIFGIVSGYGIISTIVSKHGKAIKIFAIISLILLIFTAGYTGNALNSFYSRLANHEDRPGLDATAFLETSSEMKADSKAIRYLQQNVKGLPVCLEANGYSYTAYERVSAMTGLPTVLGWYTHEQLWRNDNTADLGKKSADVMEIYTSSDTSRVIDLINEYNIEYIFVGEREKESYGDFLNHEVLLSLGEKVFEDVDYGTYIIKVK